MFFKKLILYFYVFLTVLMLTAPVNVTVIEFIPAILFLWATFGLFCFGIKSKGLTPPLLLVEELNYRLLKRKRLILLVIVTVLFVPLYIKFYTGTSLIENVKSFVSGSSFGVESTYYSYQAYFEENNLGAFSFKKLPFIVLYGVFKFYTWIYIIRILGCVSKLSVLEVITVFIVIIMTIFVGVSRGTSFELFEVIMITVFSLLYRNFFLYGRSWLTGKSKLSAYLLVACGILYFIISKSMRYEGDIILTNITSTLLYDDQSFVFKYFPLTALVLNNLSGYFLFGLYFIAFSIINIWLGSVEGGLSTLFPFGVKLFGLGDSYTRVMCDTFIDCGAAWVPDGIMIINSLGLPLYCLLIYYVGRLARTSFEYSKVGSSKHSLLLFIITLFMFSLPIGNFLTASSATIITILLLILAFVFSSKTTNKNHE